MSTVHYEFFFQYITTFVPGKQYFQFPSTFDPGKQYLEPETYRRADGAVYPCVKRFDSANAFDRRCSIAATNMIIRILNRDVAPTSQSLKVFWELPRLREIPYDQRDRMLKLEEREISFLWDPSFPILPFSSYGKTQKNTPQIELIYRTSNVARTFYAEEMENFKRDEKRIFGIVSGSLVDAVAKRARGNLTRWGLDWEKTMPAIHPAASTS